MKEQQAVGLVRLTSSIFKTKHDLRYNSSSFQPEFDHLRRPTAAVEISFLFKRLNKPSDTGQVPSLGLGRHIRNIESLFPPASKGVPQGSVLFTVNINNVITSLCNHKNLIYGGL
ncbi:hypothetical protein ATANTOWER_007569 [Ataeniobius toweri]|uniref:Uncharacterized protein n=1 Tax=Ataeniobius toweri TaxID=208326 RepID=A0ABU7AWL3_9TELE|nr:hypothetical protein [Ataeniobius toweri]